MRSTCKNPYGPSFASYTLSFLWCGTLLNKCSVKLGWPRLRAISHMRLRARDHYTSSTLIGRKGRAGPSSLHTMLEGPTEYVNASWM